MRKTNPLLILCLSLLCACTQVREDELALQTIDRRHLPPADLTLEIDGLGPCTNQPDRTLRLSSRDPVVVLVHGCLASTGRFRALAEVFAFQGQQAICFTYDDRDSLRTSGHELRLALDELAQRMDQQPITLIGHSQGGLISRYALTESGPAASALSENEHRLVTLSTPFSGIESADHCGWKAAHVLSLGLVVGICKLISGDKWFEITSASDFIQDPPSLNPGVLDHLVVATDERDSCRVQDHDGCIEDDYVFSLEEQRLPAKAETPLVRKKLVRAGHAEIVGDSRTVPHKLIDLLQREEILHATSPDELQAFRQHLQHLFVDAPIAAHP